MYFPFLHMPGVISHAWNVTSILVSTVSLNHTTTTT